MLLSINTKIVNKPADKSQHGTPFAAVDITVDELVNHITTGHAYSAQYRGNKRKSDNFAATGILAVDIDHGMTWSEALELPYLKFFASFMHTTATHTDDNNRFRVVFELEEPITDAVVYRKAITGLVEKLGGDRNTRDAARFFYGNSAAHIHRFGNCLPATEVVALVAISQIAGAQGSGFATRDNPSVRARAPFDSSLLVKRSDGIELPLAAITPNNRTIHCPFHPDQHPSAFVVFSNGGSLGVHCHACDTTSWIGAPDMKPEDQWHTYYQRGAENHWWSWSDDEESHLSVGPYCAADGTQVWMSDSKYLPPISIQPGVTYIRSPKGSGKTEQLADIVRQLKAQGKKILLVGHRRLLLNNLAARLGIESYLRRKARDGMDTSGCLAISLESIPRYIQPSVDKFDVVMIDESEQVVSHFTSTTMSGTRLRSRNLLAHLVERAEYVICADADIGLLTSGLVYTMRGQDHPDHLILNRYQRVQSANLGNADTNEISVYANESVLLDSLFQDVGAGKRCFVATNSKKMADRIHSQIKGQHPNLRSLKITRETSSLIGVKRFTAQPATEFLKYDVVICSPALSTGVDITFPGGAALVDAVYGFFREDITTHFEIDQQLSRVRNPGKIGVWISNRTGPWETDPSVILDELHRNRDATEIIVDYTKEGHALFSDDKILDLIAWILSARRASLKNLKSLFVELRSSNGWQIQHVNTSSSTQLRKHAFDLEFAEQIVSAPDFDQTAFDMKRSLFNSPRGIDVEGLAGIRRFDLKKFYGVDNVKLELVLLDDDGAFREKYNNLKLLYINEHELAGPNKVLQKDVRDVRSIELASVDWANPTRKHRLLTELLSAAGLLSAPGVFSFTSPVSKRNLNSFVDAVWANRLDLESLFGLPVRKDLVEKPVIQLREVLKLIGLSLTKKDRHRSSGTVTDHYYLDQERWRHVVTTCGLSNVHIKRQAVMDQVKMT